MGDVYAITMMRNEDQLAASVIEHLLAEGVDHVIVADNLSTDRTRAILDEIANRWPVTVVDDPDPAYRQSEKMTRLAALARDAGAEWIIPFDADELWFGKADSLAATLRASTDADVLIGDWYDHIVSLRPGRNPFTRMPRRLNEPDDLPKVAFRALPGITVHQGNHGVTGPETLREVRGRIVIHHYRWRSFGHFVRKNRAGKAAMDAGGADLRQDWSAQWRRYGGRSRAHLLLTFLNLRRVQLRAGTVLDPQRPSRMSD